MFKQRHFTILCTQKKKQDCKMAHGSYSAWLGVCKVFVCFSCVCFSNKISFTRDELLNIRQNTPQNLLPDFKYSVVLLDIVVGGAVALVKCYRTCRRGKRAGTLVKLHWHNTGQQRYICRISSWSDLIAMQNQRGNCAAAGHAFTSMRGGVHM